MARPKKDDSVEMAAINFRCKAELKASLEDLAASCRQDVSAILIELVGELVAANKARIEKFRKAAAKPINKPTCITPSTPKKPARTPRKKKDAAQVLAEQTKAQTINVEITTGEKPIFTGSTSEPVASSIKELSSRLDGDKVTSDELKGGDGVAEN